MFLVLKKFASRIFGQQGSYRAQVSTVAIGTGLSHLIAIVTLPALSRFYSAEAFGAQAIFVAIYAPFAIASTGRYELAIPIPEKDEDAWNLLAFTLIISATLGCVSTLLLIFVLSNFQFASFESLGGWTYALPLVGTGTAISTSLTLWMNRLEEYMWTSAVRITQALSTALIALSSCLFFNRSDGLLIGLGGGLALGIVMQVAVLFRKRKGFPIRLSWMLMAKQAKLHSHFPRHLLASHLIGTAHQQLPILVMEALFSTDFVGQVAMANRIVYMPVALIANSIGDVFRQKAGKAFRSGHRFDKLFLSTLKKTAVVSLIAIGPFVLFSPWAFPFFLGEKWSPAGSLAVIISLGAIFSFVITPLDKAAVIVGATRYVLYWHLSCLALNVLLAVLTINLKWTDFTYVAGITMIRTLLLIIDSFFEFKFSKRQ